MQRLSAHTQSRLGPDVQPPAYDRTQIGAGILHLGVGAFHRAHQAVYTDTAIGLGGGNWGIIGASLRSDTAASQLNPQDGLYTLRSESAVGHSQRLIGAIKKVLTAPRDSQELDRVMADPAIKVITLTITEKGYCLGNNGWTLDADLPSIKADLHQPTAASSAIGVLARGLRQRKDQGGAPVSIISCDNLTENSRRLQGALKDYLRLSDPSLLSWLDTAVRFPCSMVDRIVPAVDADALAEQENLLGLRDEAVVITEPFCQWVIENDFADATPDWAAAGATLVEDIRPYEAAKLRLLNASHSAIAYIGLLAELETVADVVRDPQLGEFIAALLYRELIPAIEPPPGFDLPRYGAQLLERFANPRLRHRCAQIAMDGTEKIRLRWLQTLEELPGDSRLLKALACWAWIMLETPLPIEDSRSAQLLCLRTDQGDLAGKLPKLAACLGLNVNSAGDWSARATLVLQHLDTIRHRGLRSMLKGH